MGGLTQQSHESRQFKQGVDYHSNFLKLPRKDGSDSKPLREGRLDMMVCRMRNFEFQSTPLREGRPCFHNILFIQVNFILKCEEEDFPLKITQKTNGIHKITL